VGRIVIAVVALAGVSGAPVAACSGAMVEVSDIRGQATRIVVGTIVGARGDAQAPDALAIEVDSVIRGTSPATLVLEPPSYMGCDGRIFEPIGTRVVVATGPHYFSASPPQELHPYWVVRADGTADPVGISAEGLPRQSLGDLAAWLGGSLMAVEPEAEPAPAPALGWTAISFVLIGLFVGGMAVLVLVAIAGFRRSRPA
jgi:hypothetical protein